uniref:Si:dkeyp-69b9.3 n=1 Tax=Xiphophorus couchianus TaxID=32473 RepID=A0A3B5MQD5_9TELE
SLNTEQHAALQAPSISSLPGLPVDQPLSDCSAVGLTLNNNPSHSGLTLLPATAGIRQPLSVTLGESNSLAPTGRPNGMFLTSQTTPLLPKTARPPSPICPSSLPPPLNFNHLTRPRKPRDIKPKMKKLKYHQYIPPDQKGHNDLVKSCGASPLSLQPVPATTNQTQTDANLTSKPELLPANLVDLTLRQQLRKRGLPVSGTKPALLQRLRPFQLQHACPTPAPLSKLGTSMEPLSPCAPLPPGSLHPFLQQDPGRLKRQAELNVQTEVLFCDVIGHDFELPLQITASPAQTSLGIRSLEEELQEAIQKAQMDPRQSIDDILDSAAHSLPDRSPAPQTKQPQPFQQQDDNFLPSPLCSSLLLELPPSPAVINPSQVVPAPPPLPICTSPSPSTRKSRKRRAPAQFDAADWLETLTSGLHPLTPPKPPFVESDFSLDSDLNVNRVLDLLIEQW